MKKQYQEEEDAKPLALFLPQIVPLVCSSIDIGSNQVQQDKGKRGGLLNWSMRSQIAPNHRLTWANGPLSTPD